MWNQSLVQLFEKGGLVMWPILACSILGVAIILDRALYFARMRFSHRNFYRELESDVRAGRIREAIGRCQNYRHPVPRMAAVYLENLNQPEKLRRDLLSRDGGAEIDRMERRLRGLAAMSHIVHCSA